MDNKGTKRKQNFDKLKSNKKRKVETSTVENPQEKGDSAEIWQKNLELDPSILENTELSIYPPTGTSINIEISRHYFQSQLQRTFKILCSKLKIPNKSQNNLFEKWQFSLKHAENCNTNKDTSFNDPILTKSSEIDEKIVSDFIATGISRNEAVNLIENISGKSNEFCKTLQQQISKEKKFNFNNKNISKKVTIVKNNNNLDIVCGKISLKLNEVHFEKLKELYSIFGKNQENFLTDLFCLLIRYKMLEGGGFQAAVNENTFKCLNKHFSTSLECFASPLNCFYPRFCSAFLDTDFLFGSIGSFFHFFPKEGSFEANPPFVPEIIEKMNQHILNLFENTKKSLSFIIIIPFWNNLKCWNDINENKYNIYHFKINQKNHSYCEGMQHTRKSRYRMSSFHTSVFFLQNKKAIKKWPITNNSLNDLLNAFGSTLNNFIPIENQNFENLPVLVEKKIEKKKENKGKKKEKKIKEKVKKGKKKEKKVKKKEKKIKKEKKVKKKKKSK